MPGLLDVVLLYDCNLACDYCTISPEMRRRSTDRKTVVEAMRRGRDLGYDRLSITGGEPTLRRDLLDLVRLAKSLGYGHVKLQSNGLVLGQSDNARRLADAGVDAFSISVHTHRAAEYDALVGRMGAHALMVAGLEACIRSTAAVAVDLIIKKDTYPHLLDAAKWAKQRGVEHVDLWFVSLTDHNRDNVASLPTMKEVVPMLGELFGWARRNAMTVRSLHIPRCLLGEDHPHAFDPGAQRVMVVTPDASFELKESALAGHVKVPACEGCQFESHCPGLRDDYLGVYGDVEVALGRGVEPSRKPPRLPLVRSGE